MLSDEEQELLTSLLELAYRELKEEIYKTDNSDYKAQLKAREHLFEGLIEKLGIAVDTAH
ncbi:MAG TPA: hypothetical protein VIP09_12035 [Dehalococcoidia bacterium]|jgi:hypothetical protein